MLQSLSRDHALAPNSSQALALALEGLPLVLKKFDETKTLGQASRVSVLQIFNFKACSSNTERAAENGIAKDGVAIGFTMQVSIRVYIVMGYYRFTVAFTA